MTMPWRRFNLFHFNGCYGYDLSPAGVAFDQQSDWNSTPRSEQIMGDAKYASARKTWQGIFKPKDETYEVQTSMDNPASIRFRMTILPPSIGGGVSTVKFNHGEYADPAAPTTWDKNLASGQTYDGVNSWASFPLRLNADGGGYQTKFSDTITIANLPEVRDVYSAAWNAAIGQFGLPQYYLSWFRNGHFWRLSNYDIGAPSGWPNNTEFNMNIDINYCVVKYFNPVVNIMSRGFMTTSGGVSLVFTGLGFHNSDADIEEGGDANPGAWNDDVDKIFFIGLQGQGTYTLTSVAGDFTVDSNTQITIATMPVMATGTYEIKLEKDIHAVNAHAGDPVAYAGDWYSDDNGEVRPGIRVTFLVSDTYEDRDGDTPIILTKWKFKKGDVEVFKWYSPIDVISPSTFYDGRIMSSGLIRRALDDRTGLFQNSEAIISLSNVDKEFSKLLAQYIVKNQVVEIYTAFKSEPEGFKNFAHQMIVVDHSRPEAKFSAQLKDITAKYFQIKIPLYKATVEDYPNIHDRAKGQPIPEALGLFSNTDSENPGAIEALYTDTANYEYLAARGSLKSIDAVYGDGALIAPADYSIIYRDGGKTYIRFTSDQADKKITFNGKGYIYAPWNSGNGYVQSPTYIMAFLLAFLAEVPVNFLNLASFSAVQDIMIARGWDKSAYFVIQHEQDLTSALQELLYTFGIKSYPNKQGQITIGIKDISNFSTSFYIREQIDVLGSVVREDNTKDAFNTINAKFEGYPVLSKFRQEKSGSRATAIDDYEATIEPSFPPHFKWTSNSDIIAARIIEELYRYSYGNYKLKFPVTFDFYDDLDVFTNFRFQDLWGLSADGSGESGRFYYVEGLNYDYINNRIDVEAIDLQWLLRQYFILGDEGDHVDNWANTVEMSKMYGYLANEVSGKFADGEDGKILIDETGLEA